MPAFLRVVLNLLRAGAVLTLLFVFKEWAYVATYRLYLDHRVDDAADSTATQRFDVEEARVVPRIVMRDDRVSFRAATGQDSTILAKVSAAGQGSYEIHVHQDDTDRIVARGDVTDPVLVAGRFPTGNGVIELVSHGEVTWSDLRLRRDLRIAPPVCLLGALLGCSLVCVRALRRRRSTAGLPVQPAGASRVWPATVTVLVSVAMAVVIMEAALRAIGSRVSSGIRAARHDLGELTEDPRWQHSPRYGRRINTNIAATNAWHYGDIVRMGFIPPAVAEGRLHQYALRTDAEGFRNTTTRDDIEVAALGDSFTDALTMPIEAAWTSEVERIIGLPVQNYGTAGFGPQQELLVLEDYVLRHRPRVVVLAFFAGNDIRDAEAFELFQQAGGKVVVPTLGWPIKDIVTRFDTWYVVNAVQAAAAATHASALEDHKDGTPILVRQPSAPDASPGFDRGMFTVPVNGSILRWAFMPPYLNLLNFSEQEWTARRGWALTRDSVTTMQRRSHEANAEFVILFLPFKSQVYLPLLERTFSRDRLAKAFQFSLGRSIRAQDIGRMSRNRLALNALMRRFCEEMGIPFLDMTDALRSHVDAGENMYFPDDSHLNEAGAAVVARSLAAFLRDRALIGRD